MTTPCIRQTKGSVGYMVTTSSEWMIIFLAEFAGWMKKGNKRVIGKQKRNWEEKRYRKTKCQQERVEVAEENRVDRGVVVKSWRLSWIGALNPAHVKQMRPRSSCDREAEENCEHYGYCKNQCFWQLDRQWDRQTVVCHSGRSACEYSMVGVVNAFTRLIPPAIPIPNLYPISQISTPFQTLGSKQLGAVDPPLDKFIRCSCVKLSLPGGLVIAKA